MNLHRLILLVITFFIGADFMYAHSLQTGIFDAHQDIGSPQKSGSVDYSFGTQKYKISGSGRNMWFSEDEFHFLYKWIKGDFILYAQMDFMGKGVNPHRKAGVIIRKNLSSGSSHVNACVHGDGLTSLQYRKKQKMNTEEIQADIQAPEVIQLERHGDTYIMSVAKFGDPFITEQISRISMGDSVVAGLYVCSHDSDVIESAVFKNVRIIYPADRNFIPYEDYIGSNIEILNVSTGLRKILYTDPGSLQAPNWHPSGLHLIYNSTGLLYHFDLLTSQIHQMETGFATGNNNDHVLSSDGQQLGISHHSDEHNGKSIIYILPSSGGEPKQITSLGPSYLHGWSPDGRHLIYTAEHSGQFDIYKIAVDSGKEMQLTDTAGLDDGSEYTPDGKYIYFNSNRTGTMQIWRMRPDGKDQEQITFDEYNDWFPHISPDGKRILFLSYMPDIDSGEHPFYKHVYLRIMSLGCHKPEIIAYVYGGQGTINVPSWSPDSRYVAFISNSKINKQL